MIKDNKWKVIISSLIILFPIFVGIILWNELPNNMVTHWGADGNPDGFGSKTFAVFVLPVIMFVLHLACLFFTSLDKKQKGQNKKALGIIFWIVPFTSLFANSIVYSAALGKTYDFDLFIPILLGLVFVFIGNYLPKIKQNRTLGIKISWALNNEENWNKTHRFGGKVWVIGGMILLFSVFLPDTFMILIMVCVIIALAIIPMVYSYCVYRQHQREGILYVIEPRSKGEKIAVRITAVFVPILLVGVAIMLFTGNIDIHYGDNSFKIDASYWGDLEVEYSEVDSIEYREDIAAGSRTYGFGSPRLSMGTFHNEEFGTYTRYAYTNCESSIALEVDGKILVISGNSKESTKEIYEVLSTKINK